MSCTVGFVTISTGDMKDVVGNTLQAKRAKRLKKPKHKTIIRAYSFPMVVEAKQHDKLMMTLKACWRLRNNLVDDRKANREANKGLKRQGVAAEDLHYLFQSDQYSAIPEYVRKDTALSKVHSQVMQNVAVRVAEGHKRFFEALKKEGCSNVRPPQRIEFKKYRSITYPQYGTSAHIKRGKLYLSSIGVFQLYDYRKVKGKPKTVTAKFKQGRWWAIVTAEIQEKDQIEQVLPKDTRPDGGIDTGLTFLMTDSFGHEYDPPKAWYEHRDKLCTAQKKMSRQFECRKKQHQALVAQAEAENRPALLLKDIPYSNRLKSQIKKVAKIHTKIQRIRDCHHKKNASILNSRYKRVAVEEHPVQFMIKNKKLAKVTSDRVIHKQKLIIKSTLGKRYISTDVKREGIGGNSQTCICGEQVPKELKERVHSCPSCGLRAVRDHVSANIVSIIAFGYASVTLSPAAGQAVVRRGEDKGWYVGESRPTEPKCIPASESPMKRQPPVQERNTTGAEATVGGKTPVHRKTPALPGAPKVVRCGHFYRRRHASKDVKRADSV
jgi:putative transposase